MRLHILYWAVFYLMLSKVGSLSKSLKVFKEMGGWVVVVERGGKDIRDFDFPTGCALVLGSEGEGVSKSLMEIADAVVSIPMVGKINSLNVSSANIHGKAQGYAKTLSLPYCVVEKAPMPAYGLPIKV